MSKTEGSFERLSLHSGRGSPSFKPVARFTFTPLFAIYTLFIHSSSPRACTVLGITTLGAGRNDRSNVHCLVHIGILRLNLIGAARDVDPLDP
jgi:hypothetical protein